MSESKVSVDKLWFSMLPQLKILNVKHECEHGRTYTLCYDGKRFFWRIDGNLCKTKDFNKDFELTRCCYCKVPCIDHKKFYRDYIKKYSKASLKCGICGDRNTLVIHHGSLSEVYQCTQCGNVSSSSHGFQMEVI